MGDVYGMEFDGAGRLEAAENLGFAMPNGHTGAVDVGVPGEGLDENEALWAIDHEADEQTIKDSLPPAGDYEVQLQSGPLEVKEVEGLQLPNQRYFGMGEREVDGKTHRARIRFALCPRKFKRVNGKIYWAYLMYVSAKKAFVAVNKQAPTSYEELGEWLVNNVVKARISHTDDNDYMTVEIKPVFTERPLVSSLPVAVPGGIGLGAEDDDIPF